jgi:hypothetical protein
MNEFLKTLSESLSKSPVSLITLLVMMVSMLAVFPQFFRILLKEKNKRINSKEKLFKLLDSNLKKVIIKNREDIILLMNSVNREYYEDYSLAPVLEDYIAYLSDKDDETLKDNYELLKEIIKKENEEKPFSNLPDQERRLMKSIDDSVKHNDIESIKYNLQELNSVITTRNKVYQKANLLNRWSIPVAIIGILLTIFFGIMSLRTPIDYSKIKEINNDLTKSLKIEKDTIKAPNKGYMQ